MKIFLISVIFIFISFNNLLAFHKFLQQGVWSFDLGLDYSSGKSFYDLDGELVNDLKNYDIENPDIEYLEYGFELTFYHIHFGAGYSVSDDLLLYADIPLGIYLHKEKYNDDQYHPNGDPITPDELAGLVKTRPSYSLVQPAYFALGGRYKLTEGTFFSSLKAELRIPPGFDESILNDPDYPFLSDGAFVFLAGGALGVDLNGLKLGGQIDYYFRGEELEDQLSAMFELGLSTVEDTELRGWVRSVSSMAGWDNAYPINPRETPLQEEYINVGFSFEMLINNVFRGTFAYELPLSGKNTYNMGVFMLRFSYLLKS